MTLSKQQILYGLNTPFFLQHDKNWPKVETKRLVDELSELGVEQIRIPLSWFHLIQKHTDSNLIWNNAYVDLYSEFLDLLPPQISVLAVPLHVPHVIAVEHFYNPQTITTPFLQFLSGIQGAFKKIQDWEIWNEPNAGDFYLSVKDGTSHRPWTANEFIDHLLLPAARFLKQKDNNAKICASGFAENGLVGHVDRKPALSNRLPKTDEFLPMLPKIPHGHFYFIPNFADEFFDKLSAVIKSEPGLVDAVAYHPYPYWQIYTRRNKDLIESTRNLITDFNHLVKKYKLENLEVWITEVGARSLQMANKNFRDEKAQAIYLDTLYHSLLPESGANRIYWYKLIDKSFDLKQEKTFGLLDIWGNRKPSYYKLKSIQRYRNITLNHYVDTFKYAHDHDQGGLDPNEWQSSQTDNHGYCIPSVKKYFSGVLVHPGKGEDAQVSWVNQSTFVKRIPESVKISMDLDSDIYPEGACISFFLQDKAYSDSFLIADYCFLKDKIIIGLKVKSPSHPFESKFEYSFHNYPSLLQGVFLDWHNELITVGLCVNDSNFYRSQKVDTSDSPQQYHLTLSVRNLGKSKSFVGFGNLKLSTEKKYDSFNLYPEDDKKSNGWTSEKSPFSQIDQDEWVLRATNYKTNGYFVEIGGHDGVSNSNTVLLERNYDWKGIIVEANPRHYKQVCTHRQCTAYNYAIFPIAGQKLEFVDAGAVGGLLSHLQNDIHKNVRQRAIDSNKIISVPSETLDNLLERSNSPDFIDYMSVDTEGSELEVLQSCDFNRWKIALITVEHGGVEKKRDKINKYMSKFGYERKRVWFEDWFYHPEYITEIIGTDGVRNVESAFQMLPFERKSQHTEKLNKLIEKNDFVEIESLMKELVKDFYPDNIVAYVNYSKYLLSNDRIEKAILMIRHGHQRFPRNETLLKLGIETFAKHNRNVLLIRFLEFSLKAAKNILQDKQIIEIIKEKQDDLVCFISKRPNLKNKNKLVFEYLNTAKTD